MNFSLIDYGQKVLIFNYYRLISLNVITFAVLNKRLTYDKQEFLLKKVFSSCFFTLMCLLLFFLSGCSSTYAPVEHRSSTPYNYSSSSNVKKKYVGKTPAYHKVKRGETLYSIAWKYSQDYKTLAYRNKIKTPYRIFIGDNLRLTQSFSKKTKVSRNTGRYNSSKKAIDENRRASSNTRTAPKSSKKVVSNNTSNKAARANKKSATYTGSMQLRWSWPVRGKVIQRYSPGSGKKGIDISAVKGSLIKSAEAGKVVYSGQGLVGYGRLIIIKHNATFLSAYAHNHSLLVNEGQVVKKGQNIARLGRSGTDRYKLHFEIRKNGKPVNPLSYLPR